MIRFLFVFLGLVAVSLLHGQNTVEMELKSGLTIKGYLLDVKADKYVVISTTSADSLVLDWERLASINFTELSYPSTTKKKKYYSFPDSALFGMLDVRLGTYNGRWGVALVPGTSFTLGTYLNKSRYLGVGVRVGADWTYNMSSNLIPVGAVLRGNFRSGGVSPFYDLGIGYSFPQHRGALTDGESVNGGAFVNPSIGVIYKRNKHLAHYFKLGYRYTSYGEKYYSSIWQPGVGSTQVLVRRQFDLQSVSLSAGLYFD